MSIDKTFVVITNAVRESICNSNRISGEVEVSRNEYRKGKIGLIHPYINEFYSNLDKNMIECDQGDSNLGIEGLKQSSPPWRNLTGLFGLITYEHEADDIPVLVYNGRNLKRNDGPIMTILKEGEFERIKGNSLQDVIEGVRTIYRTHNIAGNYGSTKLDSDINYNWRNLESFDLLWKDRLFEIPVEVTRRKISKGERKREEDYYKGLHECEVNRMKSMICLNHAVGF